MDAEAKKEYVLRSMKLQLKKDPESLHSETSCYGGRGNVSANDGMTGRRLNRSYGEAPYLSEETEEYYKAKRKKREEMARQQQAFLAEKEKRQRMKGIRFEFVKDATSNAICGGLPQRKTSGSAGYDFICPEDIEIKPGETVKIPTYIKAYMPKDVVLKIYIRSSLGIKKHLMLSNCTGIIDSDYADNPDNEGCIIGALFNAGDETQYISQGDAFMQGLFVHYLTTDDDDADGERIGGIGSTGR